MREWRNWQTRTFEGRVVTPDGFKSRFSHQTNKTEQLVGLICFIQAYDVESLHFERSGRLCAPTNYRFYDTQAQSWVSKSRFSHQTKKADRQFSLLCLRKYIKTTLAYKKAFGVNARKEQTRLCLYPSGRSLPKNTARKFRLHTRSKVYSR